MQTNQDEIARNAGNVLEAMRFQGVVIVSLVDIATGKAKSLQLQGASITTMRKEAKRYGADRIIRAYDRLIKTDYEPMYKPGKA